MEEDKNTRVKANEDLKESTSSTKSKFNDIIWITYRTSFTGLSLCSGIRAAYNHYTSDADWDG